MTNKIFSIKNIPNGLSLLRLLSVLPFILTIHDILIYDCLRNWVLLLALTIIISDIADGFLARKLKCATDIAEWYMY